MSTFVHLTSEKNLPGIQRAGIKPELVHYPEAPRGVFCMPVAADFFATHQWARELMRFGMRNPYGVYFRVPDGEEVVFGRYNEGHRRGTAAEAAAAFGGQPDKMGFQVIVPRKVTIGEIQQTRRVPPLGWRFYPAAKGRAPCLCPACISRGEYGSHKILLAELDKRYAVWRRAQRAENSARSKADTLAALTELAVLIDDHRLPLPQWPELLGDHLTDEELLERTVQVLSSLYRKAPLEAVLPWVQAASPGVQGRYAGMVLLTLGEAGKALLETMLDVPQVAAELREYEEWAEE